MKEKLVLYTTGCPKCRVLEKKLKGKEIDYEVSEDMNDLIEKNILSVPVLKVGCEFLLFEEAVRYCNGL